MTRKTRTRRRVNGNTNVVSDECPCGEELDEGVVMLSCSECETWWHACCVNLKGITEEMAATIEDWKCPHCYVSRYTPAKLIKSSFPEVINSGSCSVGKEELRKMIKEELATVKSEIVTISKENVNTYATVLKNEVKQVADKKSSKELAKQVVVQMDVDNLERKKRETNIVIKGVKECLSDDKESNNRADIEFLVETCEIKRDDIVSCFRAGKKVDDSAGKVVHRPLVAKLKAKENALYYTKNGKGNMIKCNVDGGADGETLQYWINLDLCRADREAQFFARQEQRKRLNEKKQNFQTQAPETT